MTNENIIILNGTSSSGKTSIVHALQEILEAPHLEAGIDKFIFMLPERYLDRPLWDQGLNLNFVLRCESCYTRSAAQWLHTHGVLPQCPEHISLPNCRNVRKDR